MILVIGELNINVQFVGEWLKKLEHNSLSISLSPIINNQFFFCATHYDNMRHTGSELLLYRRILCNLSRLRLMRLVLIVYSLIIS